MLRLKVDSALAVTVLSKMMCSSPCVDAANVGLLGMNERQGNHGLSPSTFGFLLGSAGLGVLIWLHRRLINKSGPMACG